MGSGRGLSHGGAAGCHPGMALTERRTDELDILLERGRLAYQAGRWVDAVAHWEKAWRSEVGGTRQLLQGLMQAAGAYQKRDAGHRLGMMKLLSLAIERLDLLPGSYGGVALDRFRSGLDRSWNEGLRWSTGGPAPESTAPLLRRP
jgi:hypothetical protein